VRYFSLGWPILRGHPSGYSPEKNPKDSCGRICEVSEIVGEKAYPLAGRKVTLQESGKGSMGGERICQGQKRYTRREVAFSGETQIWGMCRCRVKELKKKVSLRGGGIGRPSWCDARRTFVNNSRSALQKKVLEK